MNIEKFIGGGYASPSVKRFDVSVEKGFAVSSLPGLKDDPEVDLE